MATLNRQAVRDFRRARKLTQHALAERVGVSRAHLNRVEKGHRGTSPDLGLRLAHALGVNPASITLPEEEEHADE